MNRSLLSWTYKVMQLRATQCALPNFPNKLSSLSTQNPTSQQINEDTTQLSKYYNHPIFINFLPTYQETSTDPLGAILKRYLELLVNDINSKIKP